MKKICLTLIISLFLTISYCQKGTVYLFVTYSPNGLTGTGWIKADVQKTGYDDIDTSFTWATSKKFPTASMLTNEFSKRGWVLDKVTEKYYIFRKEL